MGERHDADIATIASAYVLTRPAVGAVIVGARNQKHALANAKIMEIALTDADKADIEAVLARRTGPQGDIYTLERDRTGRHGSIMHYNLNDGRH